MTSPPAPEPAEASAPQQAPEGAANFLSALDGVWLILLLVLLGLAGVLIATAESGSAGLAPGLAAYFLVLCAGALFYLRALIWVAAKVYRRFSPLPPGAPKRSAWVGWIVVPGLALTVLVPVGLAIYDHSDRPTPNDLATSLLNGQHLFGQERYELRDAPAAIAWGLTKAEQSGQDPAPLVEFVLDENIRHLGQALPERLKALLATQSLPPDLHERLEAHVAEHVDGLPPATPAEVDSESEQ